jgi:branched-chain amino acid transport system ATP-binding protein
MNILELEEINSYYDDSHIVFDLSMEVGENEVVALLGRNGAGKSTTLKTAAGVLHPRSGTIRLAGEPIHHLPSHQIARRGVQLVPEERRIFGGLSVEENLQIATLTAPMSWPLDRIYQLFPRLAERCHTDGRHLSGGEQQMLAIARALIRNPRLILLDEPFEGLATAIVRALMEVCHELVAQGQTMVIVEQNVPAVLALADRVYILNNGQRVFHGTPDELRAAPEIAKRYLGV